jgi:hypothetical protein
MTRNPASERGAVTACGSHSGAADEKKGARLRPSPPARVGEASESAAREFTLGALVWQESYVCEAIPE